MSHRRKYRRRRFWAMVVLAALALFLSTRAGAGANEPLETYTVTRGDTLWSIAVEEYPPSDDPRTVVSTIQRVNDLESPHIQPGMTLYLPAA
jgi:LysM repeat protein